MAEIKPGYYWFTNKAERTLYLVDLEEYISAASPGHLGIIGVKVAIGIATSTGKSVVMGAPLVHYADDSPLRCLSRTQFMVLKRIYSDAPNKS